MNWREIVNNSVTQYGKDFQTETDVKGKAVQKETSMGQTGKNEIAEAQSWLSGYQTLVPFETRVGMMFLEAKGNGFQVLNILNIPINVYRVILTR